MPTDEQADDFQRLHHLITSTDDVKGFLDGMTRYAATTMSRATGATVECAVTLWRRKRALTVAGSSDEAILLDGVEQSIGEGPAQAALSTEAPILLADAGADDRWPKYAKDLVVAGVHSVLGVPLVLGDDAAAALNFFSPARNAFSKVAVHEAMVFADIAAQALRLALRIATADLLAEDLKAAMVRRTVIDLACGVIMAQSNCSQEEAFDFLLKASQNRNQKLHGVAGDIISAKTVGDTSPRTVFDN
ncbi:GAF and ANTAR domain-containing protein [Paenarthrobacter ilicis]|uniref:GAF and ANTAR domain-containing protein n=1 Tax=Paenarthrobacter ilicis TaxID=43665 RepID=UPI0028D2E805|nr:GAF and ANTAR domain-containing protein [Paenarthrobacter ilicis]